MADFCNRLLIDSRWRTPASVSSTSFTIDLREALQCTGDTVCHVRTACFPVSWWTSAPGRDRLALRLMLEGAPEQAMQRYDLFVPVQQGYHNGYDFAEAMQQALKEATADVSDVQWEVIYIPAQNRIVAQWGDQPAPARSFQFFGEADLRALPDWSGPAFDSSNPGLLDDVLRMNGSSGGVNVGAGTWVSGLYDASAGIHQVFLRSSLGRSLANGPRPVIDRDVLCCINVTEGYGEVQAYQSTSNHYDFTPVYFEVSQLISFRLTDYRGRVVDLAGGEFSCELLFHQYPHA